MHMRVHVLGDAADPEGLELFKRRDRDLCVLLCLVMSSITLAGTLQKVSISKGHITRCGHWSLNSSDFRTES